MYIYISTTLHENKFQKEADFNPSFGNLVCLATLKSCDTTIQPVCGCQYIYIYIYICGAFNRFPDFF